MAIVDVASKMSRYRRNTKATQVDCKIGAQNKFLLHNQSEINFANLKDKR